MYCLLNDKNKLKNLVKEPGVQKKTFGYRVIHQKSLKSCPGQIKFIAFVTLLLLH